MPHVIAVSNQKGGVGKTTTSVNLAASLAHLGHPTLLIDLDPQGNASSGVGCPMDEVEVGTYDVLLGNASLDECTYGTSLDGLDVVPATHAMIGAEIELYGVPRAQLLLRNACHEIAPFYDFVVLDGPPSLGMLTVNALAAAHSVLVPVQGEYFALEGVGMLMRSMAQVRKSVNPGLRREGLLITMYDHRNRLCRAVEDELRGVFGDEVFDTVIPRNVRLGEAPSHGEPVLAYEPMSVGARSYLALAQELLDKNHAQLLLERSA
ncbi:MAG: ParA family protein [Proteobacteria bacterium]|nr:ParA family protein [Pseudomonadota bacterium]MCP4916323.1 ParA family protein [Pseudomonadota bacterium]